MKRYKKKVTYVAGTSVVTDEPNKRGEFHLVDCLRYLCAYDPEYHKPEQHTEEPWYIAWAENRRKQKGNSGVVYLAPNSYSETWIA
jgi:hypothetical protein